MSFLTSIYSLGNIMDEVDIEDLTIEQYLRLTQESQTPKKIEDMTIAEYLEYEKKGAESDYDSEDMEEEVEYMTDDEVVMSEQEESNHGYTQNIQHFEEKDDVDEWLNAEITKHMSMQGVENMKDALISIIKSIRQEMKDGIMKRKFEALTASVSDEVSSITSNEVDRADDNTPNTAPCRLPKELSPRSFLLPFNINNHNLYATTTLDAKDNIMPQRVYEYLGLDKLRDTSTLENTTGTNEHLGTINILVKFGELEFPCNFVIKMAEDVIILGRPFLESTRAQIDVFNEEISFEIGSKKFKFNIDSYQSIEKIYMVSIGQAEETFNPLEIGINLFSYESPACLQFEQRNRSYGTPKPIGHNNLHESDREFIFNEWILNTYDVKEEYAREIGKKGYVLDDVWEKCQQNYKKTNEVWHDEGYEEDEMWRSGDEKTDYDPPILTLKPLK
ncbi:phospholipase-like protein [Tanacetum coccineum]